jgi:hypothetical protein
MAALRWLKSNGGLTVPNMNMHGRAREWPQTRTLRALVAKGLADFEQGETEWTVRPNSAGEAAMAEAA